MKMRRNIEVWDYAGEIMASLQKGVLLTSQADGRVNTMTISWGTLGIEWATPIFTVFVRENRFTRQLLERNPEFTISIPHGDFDKRIFMAPTRITTPHTMGRSWRPTS